MKEKKADLQFISLATILCYLLAHGYRIGNLMLSGDSLLMVYQNDYAWQIALGRCFQPIWLFIRGSITSPWLISLLAIFWLILSVYFLVQILGLKSRFSMLAAALVMTINITFTAANATFLPWVDFYGFALFLAVLSVWLFGQKKSVFSVLGSLLLAFSLGTYQAYICVAVALMMIVILQELYHGESWRQVIRRIVKYVLGLLFAGAVYYICWKIFQKAFNIWTSDSYNGLAGMGDYEGVSVTGILAATYKNVFSYFWNPEVFVSLYFRGISLSKIWLFALRLLNLLTICSIFVTIILINCKKKTNWRQRLLQGVILLLFPLGINAVCFISKGMEHSLMVYAFIFVYILGIKLLEDLDISLNKKKYATIAMLAVLGCISWVNMVYANQVYLKKQMQETAAISLMTRIVNDIEAVEDYVPGVTPVAFTGTFNESPALKNDEGFTDLVPYGMGNTSMFYVGTDYAVLTHLMNVNMSLVRVDAADVKVQDMPSYPAEGSIAYVDDTLVVKISEVY